MAHATGNVLKRVIHSVFLGSKGRLTLLSRVGVRTLSVGRTVLHNGFVGCNGLMKGD